MTERRVLNTWKEIAAHLSRGVRTVQRWELVYRLPIRRAHGATHSVFAYADELDAFMERAKPKSVPYVRPTFVVVDVMTPNALSDLKLALEGAKFNVLTAFTEAEILATAAKYDVDGFVIDSVILDPDPVALAGELRRLYPGKLQVLVGDSAGDVFDATFPAGDASKVVEFMIAKFGHPLLVDIGEPAQDAEEEAVEP